VELNSLCGYLLLKELLYCMVCEYFWVFVFLVVQPIFHLAFWFANLGRLLADLQTVCWFIVLQVFHNMDNLGMEQTMRYAAMLV
jgi:hypothetical protein